MTILILYATYSGGTLSAATITKDIVASLGHTVIFQDVHTQEPDILSSADVIVLASPSWEYEGKDGHPHLYFMDFIKKCAGKTLPGKKFAVLGLGDSAYPNFCGAVGVLEEFVKNLQGELLIPSLRIDGFFFNEGENTAKITEWSKQLAAALT